MLRTVVVGAAGRMGQRLVSLIHLDAALDLVGAVDRQRRGQDAGALAGIGDLGIPISADLSAALADADVVIDFSLPEGVLDNVRLAVGNGCGYVIGTTGLSDDDEEDLRNLARDGARIVYAPNMSLGVNLLFRLVQQVAGALGSDYDIEIVEMHHHHKQDAPSGTAKKLGQLAAEARELDYEQHTAHGRVGPVGARPQAEIGMHALRGGDVVGEHTVIFAAEGERVELTHKAGSRDTFARGALRAARFLADAGPGLYSMQDVLRI